MIMQVNPKLHKLLIAYHQDLPNKLDKLNTCWQALQKQWEPSAYQNLLDFSHKLRGSAGTYGYTLISQVAADLENLLCLIRDRTPNATELKQLNDLINLLKTSITQAPQPSAPFTPTEENETFKQGKEIFLLESDPHFADDVCIQLSHYGYALTKFSSFTELQQAIKKQPATAYIININNLTPQQLIELSSFIPTTNSYTPLIFIANEGELATRLQAVRANGYGFFLKPLDFNILANKLNEICGWQIDDPYQILIVEDSTSLANYFSLILEQAGMKVACLNNPLEFNNVLNNFMPDLILMDLYMPDCNGLELATILRQQETFTSIPIVFLSAEDSKTTQLTAISLGGDDFLTKPIEPMHLVSIVKSRAQRSRVLRSFMVRDSLTNVFNHTSIQQMLENELARAKRQNTSLTLAMLDIDHFKNVNDTYGHPVGDKVIQSVCNLLRNRLRKIDLIGRYGGEEFLIILPNSTPEQAKQIVDEIREKFAKLQHIAAQSTFSVTFSAGLASYPMFTDSTQLVLQADKALYSAKQAGRNQIQVAK